MQMHVNVIMTFIPYDAICKLLRRRMIITILVKLINFDLHGKEWSVYIATVDEVGLHENTL